LQRCALRSPIGFGFGFACCPSSSTLPLLPHTRTCPLHKSQYVNL
jgi:hypothetical protein